MSESPSHNIRLSNGSVNELMRLSVTGGLLTKPALTRRVSQFMREHVLCRPLPDFKGDSSGMLAWSDSEFAAVEVRERTRDAIKALIASAQEKGMLSCSLGCGDLLTTFGLADDE